MARSEKTDRAARTFEWLRSLQTAIGVELARKLDKGDGRTLRPLDLCVAMSLTGWFDADLKCFRSQVAIAEDVGCSEKSAAASVARLLDAGFLLVPPVKKTKKGGFSGRPATTYRATIPAEDGISEDEVSGSTVRESFDNAPVVSGSTVPVISGSTVPVISGSTVPTNPLREPLERTPVKNTPPTPRNAGGAGVPDRRDGRAEEGEQVSEVVLFPSRQPVTSVSTAQADLPKMPSRRPPTNLAGELCPGCDTLDDEAEIFWNEYPNPEAWGAVCRAWRGARRMATFEQIMEGLDAYIRRTDNSRDRGFRAAPANWLKDRRWVDPERTERRGVETTSERMNRLGLAGPNECGEIDGPRKAPAIIFEGLQGGGR